MLYRILTLSAFLGIFFLTGSFFVTYIDDVISEAKQASREAEQKRFEEITGIVGGS